MEGVKGAAFFFFFFLLLCFLCSYELKFCTLHLAIHQPCIYIRILCDKSADSLPSDICNSPTGLTTQYFTYKHASWHSMTELTVPHRAVHCHRFRLPLTSSMNNSLQTALTVSESLFILCSMAARQKCPQA